MRENIREVKEKLAKRQAHFCACPLFIQSAGHPVQILAVLRHGFHQALLHSSLHKIQPPVSAWGCSAHHAVDVFAVLGQVLDQALLHVLHIIYLHKWFEKVVFIYLKRTGCGSPLALALWYCTTGFPGKKGAKLTSVW